MQALKCHRLKLYLTTFLFGAVVLSASQVQAAGHSFTVVFEKVLQDPAPADGILVWKGTGHIGKEQVSVETRLAASDFNPNTGAITNFSFLIFDAGGGMLHSANLAGTAYPSGRIAMNGSAGGSRVRLRARTRDGLVTVKGSTTFKR